MISCNLHVAGAPSASPADASAGFFSAAFTSKRAKLFQGLPGFLGFGASAPYQKLEEWQLFNSSRELRL